VVTINILSEKRVKYGKNSRQASHSYTNAKPKLAAQIRTVMTVNLPAGRRPEMYRSKCMKKPKQEDWAHMFPNINANDGDVRLELEKTIKMSSKANNMKRGGVQRRGSWLAVVMISSLPEDTSYPCDLR